jgi:hypothetical protein
MELSVEEMVRNLLDAAIREGIVKFRRGNFYTTTCPQELTAGDLAGMANLLAAYLRQAREGK